MNDEQKENVVGAEPFTPDVPGFRLALRYILQETTELPDVGLAEFDRMIAQVQTEAVEEYKKRQVHVTFQSPPAPQLVHMPCPRCGMR